MKTENVIADENLINQQGGNLENIVRNWCIKEDWEAGYLFNKDFLHALFNGGANWQQQKDNAAIEDVFLNMQYYMEYCQRNGYVTPQIWLKEHKHF